MIRSISLSLLLVVAASSDAADAWLLRVRGYGATLTPCGSVRLSDTIILQNTTTADARVVLRGVSNAHGLAPGQPPVFGADDLVVPAGRTRTISSPGNPVWESNPPVTRWIAHISIPDGTIVQSRLELGAEDCTSYGSAPPNATPNLGYVALPVLRELAVAGAQQRLLGTDAANVPANVHVGVVNAGVVEASAVLEFRRACDDALISTATLHVAPNALLEHRFDAVPSACGLSPTPWVHYTTITVDQPSITYALSIPKNGPAAVGVMQPAVERQPSNRRRAAAQRPE